jgi:hypothetical protein
MATPAALMFTTRLPRDELLVIVKTPVKVLTLDELNCSVNVAVCPGLRVAGTVPPETLNDEPVTGTPVIVTGAVPVELRVRVWFALCPVWTSPKFTLFVLTLNVLLELLDVLHQIAEAMAFPIRVNRNDFVSR